MLSSVRALARSDLESAREFQVHKLVPLSSASSIERLQLTEDLWDGGDIAWHRARSGRRLGCRALDVRQSCIPEIQIVWPPASRHKRRSTESRANSKDESVERRVNAAILE